MRKRTSQLFKTIQIGAARPTARVTSPNVEFLVQAYNSSTLAAELKRELESSTRVINGDGVAGAMGAALRGHHRASWTTQFRILSGRAFKNMYRDPALLAAHYAAAIIVAGAIRHR